MDYIDKRLIASSSIFLAMLLAILWYGKESVKPDPYVVPNHILQTLVEEEGNDIYAEPSTVPLPEITPVEETKLADLPPLIDVVDLEGNTDPVLEWTEVVINEELPPLQG